MKEAVDVPVTVKCRIGVDDQEPREALFAMAGAMQSPQASTRWSSMRARPGSRACPPRKTATFRRSIIRWCMS